MTLENIC